MNDSKSTKVIVIGAGIAGLATALKLRNRGYEVEVFEANDRPGGKIDEIHQEGFRFDTGPTVLTMPGLIEELIKESGAEPAKWFDYKKPEASCQYYFSDGSCLSAPNNTRDLIAALEALTTDSAKTIENYLSNSKKIYDITEPVFLQNAPHEVATYLKPTTFQSMLQLPKLKPFQTLHQFHTNYFSDPRVVQLFDRYATYNGSDPYLAPATLRLISHLEHNLGVFLPKGGMYRIVEILYQLGVQIGVAFYFNSKVEQILTKNKTIQGIQVNGATVECGKVVSNQDVQATYKDLLNDKPMPGFYRKREASSSALIFYWGVKGQFPSMQSHNILFTDQYQQEFQNLFQHQKISEDPTVYIYISAKENPEDAPEGFENWYVMVNAPSNVNMHWQTYAQKIKGLVLAKIKRHLNIDLEPLITFEANWNPAIIQQKSLSATGALYGTSSNTPLAAFLRFPNKAPGIEGLYFAGGTVHPGGGIPLCIYSAKLVTDLIDNSYK